MQIVDQFWVKMPKVKITKPRNAHTKKCAATDERVAARSSTFVHYTFTKYLL